MIAGVLRSNCGDSARPERPQGRLRKAIQLEMENRSHLVGTAGPVGIAVVGQKAQIGRLAKTWRGSREVAIAD